VCNSNAKPESGKDAKTGGLPDGKNAKKSASCHAKYNENSMRILMHMGKGRGLLDSKRCRIWPPTHTTLQTRILPFLISSFQQRRLTFFRPRLRLAQTKLTDHC